MREHPVPDLIILEFRLPEETGLEIATKLQSDSRLEAVRTILLSGLFSPRDLAAAAERDITCLQKGFCLEGWTELANYIHRCVTSEASEPLLPAA
jgi:CheY-like chemotaxis protein